MSRLQTAYDHTKYSARLSGDRNVPELCMEQQLAKINQKGTPCYAGTHIYENHCYDKCPLDSPTIFDEVLEKLCLDTAP